jgi:hypothetical protein
MLLQRYREFFARSIQLFASAFRSYPASSRDDLDALRDGLEMANGRVAQSERLVAGWREVIDSQQASGRDLEASRDLLKTFENGLEVAMSNKQEAQKAVDQRLLDIFQGAVGRLPQNDQELHDWLASPEGKAATVFEPASASRWGETGRS